MRRSVLSWCALAVSGLVLLGLGSSEQAFSDEGSAAGKARPSAPEIWAKAVSGLVEVLKGGTDEEGRKAAAILGSIGRPAIPQLIKILKSGDKTVKLHAAYALGEIGKRAMDAVPSLSELLKDKDEKLRASALENLRDILD